MMRSLRLFAVSVPLAAVPLAAVPLAAVAPGQDPTLRFAHVFGDHAVLQREKPVSLWGWADPGARVTVSLAEDEAGSRVLPDGVTAAKAGDDGRWEVQLPPRAARSVPAFLIAQAGDMRTVLSDVLVGEVWLCSGQSNMVWSVTADTEWGMERACANFPAVRYCEFGRWSATPLEDLAKPARWLALDGGDDLGPVSAVSYYFAVRLHRYLGVPVGIVNNAVGGALAETWTSRATLDSLPALADFLADFDARVAGWDEEKARRLRDWEARTAKAKAAEREPPRKPGLSPPAADRNQPGGCYNGLMVPIAGLTVRGALFLQGENNSIGKWGIYQHSFPAMIAEWRRLLRDEALPFGIISLQAFGPHGLELEPELAMVPPGLFWYAAIRDTHFRTYRTISNTGLITTTDLGDTANIHPAAKRGVGQRAARWALATVYGQPVIHRGPDYAGMRVDGKKIVLSFEMDPAIETVVKRKDGEDIWWLDWPISRAGKDYRGFLVAGVDRRFRPARVRRAKQPGRLEVWSDDIAAPVAVRYGWSGYPEGNAVGHDLLPVHPFRTDDWPLVADTPFTEPARKAWKDEMKALRARAKRWSDAPCVGRRGGAGGAARPGGRTRAAGAGAGGAAGRTRPGSQVAAKVGRTGRAMIPKH